MRVATSMDVASEMGGKIENSFGGVNEDETWGKPAQWCDYSGPVAGRKVGIAIMDHPGNWRHPSRYHVRNYGLMTANPFALSYYYDDQTLDGSMTIPAGGESIFRYRLLVHEGVRRYRLRRRPLPRLHQPTHGADRRLAPATHLQRVERRRGLGPAASACLGQLLGANRMPPPPDVTPRLSSSRAPTLRHPERPSIPSSRAPCPSSTHPELAEGSLPQARRSVWARDPSASSG